MRTITRYDKKPAKMEIIPSGSRATLYVRRNIKKITINDENGERVQYEAEEFSCPVNPRDFELSDDFTARLIAHDTAQAAAAVRIRRNTLLAASDAEILPDRDTDKAAWAAYRQALREIPEQAGFPFDVEWPVRP